MSIEQEKLTQLDEQEENITISSIRIEIEKELMERYLTRHDFRGEDRNKGAVEWNKKYANAFDKAFNPLMEHSSPSFLKRDKEMREALIDLLEESLYPAEELRTEKKGD